MILTVTINPLLEKRFIIDSLIPGESIRSKNEIYYAGGKGINVSRQLNKLGIENQALLFAGGANGKTLRRVLTEEGINFSIVNTSDETRTASLILDEKNKNITTVFGKNSDVTEHEVTEFKNRLAKMIPNCSIVVLAGSSPNKIADEIFPYTIKLAEEHDKTVILDTYGDHLSACIKESPLILHNNVSELEKSLSVNLSEDENKINFLNTLYAQGIKMAFITDGNQPTFANKFGYIYKITTPNVSEISSTGSGDAFVAGIAFGLEKSIVFEEFSVIASALGTANALKWDACNVDINEIGSIKNTISIEAIGKKMKIIDDSPTVD